MSVLVTNILFTFLLCMYLVSNYSQISLFFKPILKVLDSHRLKEVARFIIKSVHHESETGSLSQKTEKEVHNDNKGGYKLHVIT